MVTTEGQGAAGAEGAAPRVPMSLRAYARRRGTSAPSVIRAIRGQRLRESVVYVGGVAQIADPDLADREWAANTDHSRAPDYVKARGLAVTPPSVTPVTPTVPARQVAAAAAQGGATLADASTREKLATAQLRELELATKRGELMPIRDHERRLEDMQTRIADLFTLLRTKLLAVPSKVKGKHQELTLQHVAAMDEEIRAALEALADGEGVKA